MYQIQISVRQLATMALESEAVNTTWRSSPWSEWNNQFTAQSEITDPDMHRWVTTWILEELGASSFDITWEKDHSPDNWEDTRQAWCTLRFTDPAAWALLRMQHAIPDNQIRVIPHDHIEKPE
jgi:hypothetical protein